MLFKSIYIYIYIFFFFFDRVGEVIYTLHTFRLFKRAYFEKEVSLYLPAVRFFSPETVHQKQYLMMFVKMLAKNACMYSLP